MTVFRAVDLTARIRQGYREPAWRVAQFVADGTLTVLTAESGIGKSMFLQAACAAVATGSSVAGLPCARGVALYVDREMGEEMFANRAARMGATGALPYRYVEATAAANIANPQTLGELTQLIDDQGAQLVVLDSLSALAPGAKENDNDAMGPIITGLRDVARDRKAAIVLIHHRGKGGEHSFRGATAIRDQADALFSLRRIPGARVLELTCEGGKLRYDAEPPAVFLSIDMDSGGVRCADAPPGRADVERQPVRSRLRTEALAALEAAAKPLPAAAVARELGKTKGDGTLRRALEELADAGDVCKTAEGWVATSATLGGNLATRSARERLRAVEIPEIGGSQVPSPYRSGNLATPSPREEVEPGGSLEDERDDPELPRPWPRRPLCAGTHTLHWRPLGQSNGECVLCRPPVGGRVELGEVGQTAIATVDVGGPEWERLLAGGLQ